MRKISDETRLVTFPVASNEGDGLQQKIFQSSAWTQADAFLEQGTRCLKEETAALFVDRVAAFKIRSAETR